MPPTKRTASKSQRLSSDPLTPPPSIEKKKAKVPRIFKTTSFHAVWSYETGHGVRVVQKRFNRVRTSWYEKLDNNEALDAKAEKAAVDWLKRKAGKIEGHGALNRNFRVLSMSVDQVGKERKPPRTAANLREKIFSIAFKVYFIVKFRDTGEIRTMKSQLFHLHEVHADAEAAQERAKAFAIDWYNGMRTGGVGFDQYPPTFSDHYLDTMEFVMDPDNQIPHRQSPRLTEDYIIEIPVDDLDVMEDIRMQKSCEEGMYVYAPPTTGDDECGQPRMLPLRNVCVLTFIIEHLTKRKEKGRGWPKKCPETIAALAEWLGLTSVDEGVTLPMISKFCKEFKFSLYAVDPLYKTIREEKPKDRKHVNGDTFVFLIKDSHIFPIQDEGMRTHIIQTDDGSRKNRFRVYKKDGDVLAIDPSETELVELIRAGKTGLVIYSAETKDSLAEESQIFIRETKVAPMAEMSGFTEHRIHNDKLIVILAEDPHRCQKIAGLLGIRYTGQSLSALGMASWKAFAKIQQSCYSEAIRAIVQDGTFYRRAINVAPVVLDETHTEFPDGTQIDRLFEAEEHLDELVSIDITHNYPTNAGRMPTAYPVFTAMDDVQPVAEGTKPPALFEPTNRHYFFFVEADPTIRVQPFALGNGWYSEDVVRAAVRAQIPFKVTYRIAAQWCVPSDTIAKFLARLKDQLPEKGDYKAVANRLIGTFGSHKGWKDFRVTTTTDPQIMARVYYDYLAKGKETWVVGDAEMGYKVYHERATICRDEDSRPINAKIVQLTYVRLFELHQNIKNIAPTSHMVQIRTDAMTFWVPDAEERAKVHKFIKSAKGEFRIEEGFKKLLRPNMSFNMNPFEHESIPWKDTTIYDSGELHPKDILAMKGAYFAGAPGVGKSRVITRLVEYIETQTKLKYIVCSFTNLVANRLGGSTLHQAIMYGNKRVDVMIIDEASMSPTVIYNKMVTYKRKYPATMFFLFGDPQQLPPVEDFEYAHAESDQVKAFCCHNRVTFIKNYRYDTETEERFQHLYDNPSSIFKYTWSPAEPAQDTRTLVATHRDRKRVNHLHMERVEQSGIAGVWLEPQTKENPKVQAMFLHVGLPLISIQKKKPLGIDYKHQTFKVTSFEIGSDDAKTFLQKWDIMEDADDTSIDNTLILPTAELLASFYPAYALTVHVSQGSTILGSYSILNIHSFSDRRMMYTALTRTKGSWKNISLPMWESPPVDKNSLAKRLQRNVGNIYGATWLKFIHNTKIPRGYGWWDYGLDIEIDHIKPRAEFLREGITDEKLINHISNLRVTTVTLNRSKKDTIGVEGLECEYDHRIL